MAQEEQVSTSLDQKHFYAKYGNEEFYFYMSLYNNEKYLIFLQRNSVVYFEIDDNIFNPFSSATLILANDQNVFEKNPSPYVFLGNGRDILDVEIVPIKDGKFDKDSKDEKNKQFLGIRHSFVVIECVDIVYNGTTCKKLQLVEYSQYMLAENICNIFGIQKAGGAGGNYMETNSGNAKATGEVIKAILYAVYNDGNPSEDLFYIDELTNAKVFEFDPSVTVSISPHGNMSYMEVLNYVLSFHSFEKSPCILQFDRNQKKFQLISLKTLFKDHKKYTIETLRFPSPSQGENDANNPQQDKNERPAILWDTFPVTFEESKINKFYVSAPTCKYNVNLSGNSGVVSNSRSTKSMIFNTTALNSDSFMKDFYTLFVEPFKQEFTKEGSQKFEVFPNFYPNPNKKNNYNTFKGNLSPEMDEKKFLNQKMSSLLYLNNVYQFQLVGKTHRKSMSFIDVVKTAENKNGKFVATKWDMNNLGRHLITKVKHIFTFDRYSNEIETIKPYRLVDGDDNGTTLDQFLQKGA